MVPRKLLGGAARFALLPALAVLLFASVMLVAAQHLLVGELTQRAMLRVELRASLFAQQLTDSMRAARRDVQMLARSPLLATGGAPVAMRAEFDWLRRQLPGLVWIGFVAPDGTVLAGSDGWLEGRSIASRPVFAAARQHSFLGDPHPPVALEPLLREAGIQEPALLDLGEPVHDAQGRLLGVLAAHVGTGWIERARDAAAGQAPDAARLRLQFQVLMPGERPLLSGPPLPGGLPREGEPVRVVRAADGSDHFAASRALGDDLLPWRVLVLQEREQALAPAFATMRTLVGIGATIAAIAALVGYLLSRRLMQPWNPLIEAVLARHAAGGREADLGATVASLNRQLAARSAAEPLSPPEAALAAIARGAGDLKRVFDHLPVGVAVADRDLRIDYVNPTYTRLLGWSTEMVRGRLAAEFLFDAADRDAFVRQYEHVRATPAPFCWRFDAVARDGVRVAVHWQFEPLLDDEGRLQGAIAVVQDIRGERAARQRADALAGRLRALADGAVDDLLATLDFDGRVLEWSRGGERMTGLAAEAAIGRPLAELLALQDGHGDGLLEARRQAQREGRCAVAWHVRHEDGRLRWLEGALYPLGLAPGSARFGLVLHDATEQRETLAALQRSEERLLLALQAARMGTWSLDLAGGGPPAMHWSPGYGLTLGLADEALPVSLAGVRDLMHPDDRDRVLGTIAHAQRDDQPFDTEFRVPQPDGSLRWHAVHGRARRAADGHVTAVSGVGIDITARRIAEQGLQASQERLVQIVQTMREGLALVDADGCYTLLNPAAEEIVGVPAAEMLGRRYDDVPFRRHAVDGDALGPHPFERLAAGEPAVRDLVLGIERRDGTRRVLTLNAQPLHSGPGERVAMVATFVDVTERWRIERALADSEARLAAIVATASDAIVSAGTDGRVTLFNPAAERIFGRGAAEMVGGPMDPLLPPARRALHMRDIAAFTASGTTRRPMGAGRVRGVHADGRLLELEASIAQAEVNGERVVTAILRDVTERVAQERALESSRLELAELTRRLLQQEKQTTRRLAQALHDDLGQTLTALRLQWEGTHAGVAATKAEARVHQLIVNANRQIRHVLDELRPPLLDEVGLAAALDNELRQQGPLDGEPRLKLVVPDRLRAARWPADVEYAAFMIGREALVNALHHASATEITLSLEGDEGALALEVRDDGRGIASDSPRARAGRLGLVGMRERAAAIPATLQIDSRRGDGTIVTLRWEAPDPTDEPPLPDR